MGFGYRRSFVAFLLSFFEENQTHADCKQGAHDHSNNDDIYNKNYDNNDDETTATTL